jgi:hypothetical protein
MQVAGIRRVGARVEMIEVDEPRPLASDEVLLDVNRPGHLPAACPGPRDVRPPGGRMAEMPAGRFPGVCGITPKG